MGWFVFSLLCVSFVFAKHEQYDGHALFSVKVQDAEQAKYFNTLEYPFDIWQYAVEDGEGTVLVPKDFIQQFEKELYSNGIEFAIKVNNIKDSLDLEDKLMAEATRKQTLSTGGPTVSFERILTLAEVDAYLEEVAAAYPDVVTLINAGKSFEGRNVNYLKISQTNFQNTSKPIVFVESLLHAREWVTLPATLYAIQKLVVNVTENELIEDFDWIILPIVNPDGYEYSHTTDRFWRKNRRNGLLPGDTCAGVDLNRNFDILYSLGASNNVCSNVFRGRYAFSEPEARIVRDILREYNNRIELFIDIHSFGSMILYGWGNFRLPSNVFSLHIGGIEMAQAIDAVKKDRNPNYRVGNSAFMMYSASGTAQDYGKAAGVKLTYTYEMPASRNVSGFNGFLVDADFIEQAGIETWEGIKTGARFARSVMGPRK